MSIRTALFLMTAATPALAEVPNIVVDTPVTAALVAAVTGPEAEITVLLDPGVSPHDFALRPSGLQALTEADMVIWIGHGLSPWMGVPLTTISESTRVIELVDTEGWTAITYDEEVEEHHEGETEEEHEAHDHGPVDPHAWLDPSVAVTWASTIGAEIAEMRPDLAEGIAANTATFAEAVAAANTEAQAALAPVTGKPFVASHDAVAYFTRAYGLTQADSIAEGDAAAPGAAHIADLQAQMAAEGINCILLDPETNPDWAALVAEGTTARIAPIDLMGTTLDIPFTDLGYYPAIISRMATDVSACLTEQPSHLRGGAVLTRHPHSLRARYRIAVYGMNRARSGRWTRRHRPNVESRSRRQPTRCLRSRVTRRHRCSRSPKGPKPRTRRCINGTATNRGCSCPWSNAMARRQRRCWKAA